MVTVGRLLASSGPPLSPPLSPPSARAATTNNSAAHSAIARSVRTDIDAIISDLPVDRRIGVKTRSGQSAPQRPDTRESKAARPGQGTPEIPPPGAQPVRDAGSRVLAGRVLWRMGIPPCESYP